MKNYKKVLGIFIIILLIMIFISIFLIAEIFDKGTIGNHSIFFRNRIDDKGNDNNISNSITDNTNHNDVLYNNIIKNNSNNSGSTNQGENVDNNKNNHDEVNKDSDNKNNDNKEDDSSTEYQEIIKVKSENKFWSQNSQLNIFSNKSFNYENIIAPGSTGEYKFIIENQNGKGTSILCNGVFNEINEKNINMVYKIKINGQYINNEDQWKKINEFKIEDLKIEDNATCSLIWRWEDAPNDTQIGESSDANYKLNITITGVVNEG